MGEPIFRATGDGRFVPTEQARGPWDPQALHGGAPAALIAGALESLEPAPGLTIARLDYEFVRPIPMAPLRLRTGVTHPGRRAQRLEAELSEAGAGGRVVCQARALRVTTVPAGLPAPLSEPGAPPPGPAESRPAIFSLDGSEEASFAATAMEMRWARGEPGALGPATVWFRLKAPVVEGQAVTPLMRMAAAADFGNGISAEVSWADWLFVNADLGIRLQRPPRGEWIALEARSELIEGGAALARSELFDEQGPLGLAAQALVVQRR